MATMHDYQRGFCKKHEDKRPLLNASSKEDPACLGRDFDAINLDIQEVDISTGVDLRTLPNFVLGDVLKSHEIFPENHFQLIVLGEFVEHCKVHAAEMALESLHKVLHVDGLMLLTFPLDARPPRAQHAERHLKSYLEHEEGDNLITVWHQTVWEDDMLADLFQKTGFEEVEREPLRYSFVRAKPGQPQGWAIVVKKS